MKKFVFAVTVVFAVLVSFADGATAAKKIPAIDDGVRAPDGRKLSRAEIHEILYRRNGGKIKVPGIQKGVVTYVNAQKKVSKDALEQNANAFADYTKIDVNVVDGAFDLANPKILGNASLFVIDDPKLPSLLIAPESRWAMVNIATLAEGRGEKPAYFNARVQKELTRGFAMLCGAMSSNYPESLTGCVTSTEDLDKFADCQLPVDVLQRFTDYLKGYGVVPYQLKTYREACKEGWAPAPKDDVQKKIWDEIHELPSAPIAIKPVKK